MQDEIAFLFQHLFNNSNKGRINQSQTQIVFFKHQKNYLIA